MRTRVQVSLQIQQLLNHQMQRKSLWRKLQKNLLTQIKWLLPQRKLLKSNLQNQPSQRSQRQKKNWRLKRKQRPLEWKLKRKLKKKLQLTKRRQMLRQPRKQQQTKRKLMQKLLRLQLIKRKQTLRQLRRQQLRRRKLVLKNQMMQERAVPRLIIRKPVAQFFDLVVHSKHFLHFV